MGHSPLRGNHQLLRRELDRLATVAQLEGNMEEMESPNWQVSSFARVATLIALYKFYFVFWENRMNGGFSEGGVFK